MTGVSPSCLEPDTHANFPTPPITKTAILPFNCLCSRSHPCKGATSPAADLLTYEELVELYERDTLPNSCKLKLQKLLTSPVCQ